MVDPSVLNWLSNGLTIGGAVYYVAWKPAINAAVITVVSPVTEDADPLEALLFTELVNEDGYLLTFESELIAHAFLLKLRDENAVHDEG